MKFVTLLIVCVLTTTGCARNRGLTNEAEASVHNREVTLAILCGLGGHAMDSSGKCDFSRKSTSSVNTINATNNQLVFACGSVGMGVNFVTGNCVSSNGRQVNPRNVVSPAITTPHRSSQDLVSRCGELGKGVDYVTGKCL